MAGSALELRNRELMDTNKALMTTIEDLRALLKKATEQNEVLQQQVDYLTKKLFGTSSEKRKYESESQLSFFDEVEQEANSTEANCSLPYVSKALTLILVGHEITTWRG